MTTANLTDADVRLKSAVTRQLEWDPKVDASAVGVTVRGAAVTLIGFIDSYPAKLAAERVVRRGVRHIFNHITVAPLAAVRDVHRHIATALHRNADLDAHRITVTVSGTTATLSGTVGTFLQRESAERAAAQAPGIAHVENRITVEPAAEFPAEDVDTLC